MNSREKILKQKQEILKQKQESVRLQKLQKELRQKSKEPTKEDLIEYMRKLKSGEKEKRIMKPMDKEISRATPRVRQLAQPKLEQKPLERNPTRFFLLNTEQASEPLETQDRNIRQITRTRVEALTGAGTRQNIKDSNLTRKDWGFSNEDWERMKKRSDVLIEEKKAKIEKGGFKTELLSPLRTEEATGLYSPTFSQQQQQSEKIMKEKREAEGMRLARQNEYLGGQHEYLTGKLYENLGEYN